MKNLIRILLLALVYVGAGRLGLQFAFVHTNATAVWAPSGIALAVLLLGGLRLWPGVFLGAFLVNVATAGTLWTSLGIGVGNTLEIVFAAYLINRFANGFQAFNHPYTIFKYTVLSALGATVAATLGVVSLTLGGFAAWPHFWTIWTTWWLGDTAAMMIVAPFLILWKTRPITIPTVKKRLETGLVGTALIFFGGAIFGGLANFSRLNYPLEFLCTPLILWAAFRLGRRGASSAVVFISILAIGGTLNGFGPFVRFSQNESLLLLQMYMGVLAILGLVVAAVVAQREDAHHQLQERVKERTRALVTSEQRLNRLIDSNVIGILVAEPDGRVVEANDTFLKMVGYAYDDVKEGKLRMNALIPPEYRAQETWAEEQLLLHGSCPALETEMVRRDGNRIPIVMGGVILDEVLERSFHFVIDVTHRRQAMDAMRKAYDEIELRVNERTQELSLANNDLAREIELRKKAESELRNLSLKDPLTGLYNRRGFLALAEQHMQLAYRDKTDFLLFFADVDHLKTINDTFGHQKGDQALEAASQCLIDTFRKSDILARMGGDEFAVVCVETTPEQISLYTARLQERLDTLNASHRWHFKLSISIGCASYQAHRGLSLQEIMRLADENLYKYKHVAPSEHKGAA